MHYDSVMILLFTTVKILRFLWHWFTYDAFCHTMFMMFDLKILLDSRYVSGRDFTHKSNQLLLNSEPRCRFCYNTTSHWHLSIILWEKYAKMRKRYHCTKSRTWHLHQTYFYWLHVNSMKRYKFWKQDWKKAKDADNESVWSEEWVIFLCVIKPEGNNERIRQGTCYKYQHL